MKTRFPLVIPFALSGILSTSPMLGAKDQLGVGIGPVESPTRERKLAALEKMGATCARTQVLWHRVEPQPGEFDWLIMDEAVASAKRHGVNLVVTILAVSPWGSRQLPANFGKPGYQNVSPPKDLAAYTRFVHALAAHYRGRGIAWQIENEVNSKSFWNGTREEYLTQLKAAYSAMHDADPSAVVIPAGLSVPWPHTSDVEFRITRHHEWLDAILDTHACDAIDLHNYQLPAADPQARKFGVTFEEMLANYQSWMAAKNIKVPLWITECGVPSAALTTESGTLTFTPAQQAADLEQIVAAARKAGVARMIWLRFADGDDGPYTHMGLSSESLDKKPAAAVFARLAGGK